MRYFSYGSNLSIRRLRERTPSASFIASASLLGHELRFHKISRDGSAKCDAYETGRSDHRVLGALFEIPRFEKPRLDVAEGLGSGYEEKKVQLLTNDGSTVEAITYYATVIDASLRPYHWYKEHVLIGAREIGVPGYYLNMIDLVESMEDPDQDRHRLELSIYAA